MPPRPYEQDSGRLWSTGEFSLSEVLAGRARSVPTAGILMVVAWRPPARAPLLPPEDPMVPLRRPGGGWARRVSDFDRPDPHAEKDEAILRAAWEATILHLRPLAGRRIGPLDLAFAADEAAEARCPELYAQLCRDHPDGDWRVGYARIGRRGLTAAARTLELWVLDAPGEGSWLVDVSDLI